ncbi:helix-turn-helix domain-containing protein [Aedoeadaptatus coxii]|uniref:helix-turn-helix domain-containing protein n=1 Tax=Aedoeadaptatus coxii TaxID=755172 RepID=UPI003908402E
MDYPCLKIPMKIFENDRLSHAQMILYGIIFSSREEQPYCLLKNRDFERIMNTSGSSILRHLETLEEYGLIEREVIRDEKTNEVIERRIYIL